MVSRSTLISFCGALLCGGSNSAAAAAAAAAEEKNSSRPNLRRGAVEVTTFSPTSAPNPSSSLHPTPDVKSYTLHPTDTHFTEPPTAASNLADVASSIVAYGTAYNEAVSAGSCNGQIFQLDIHTDEHPEETSWILQRIQGDDGSYVTIEESFLEMHADTGYPAEVYRCLEPGQYEFTLSDTHGDGFSDSGYYLIALNDEIIGGSSGFGYTESTTFILPVVVPEARNSDVQLLNEDFDFDSISELFTASDENDVAYYNTIFDRDGVVRIQNSNGYIATGNILPPSSSFSTFTVTFSYRTNSMEEGEGFCLDFSTDVGDTWNDEKCYVAGEDFENGLWYDDIDVQFDAEDITGLEDSLSIRLISKGNSYNDDVLIDKIEVVGSM